MAETVGSVEIKLLLDREQFDLDLLELREEPPLDLAMRAGLDLKQLQKDLNVLQRRSIDIDLNTIALSRQLDAALQGRSVDIKARLSTAQFRQELEGLEGRSVRVRIDLDDRFDSRGLDQRIRDASRDRTVDFIGIAKFNELQNSIDEISENKISFKFDDAALQPIKAQLEALKSGEISINAKSGRENQVDDKKPKAIDDRFKSDISSIFRDIQKDLSKAYASSKPGIFTNSIRGFQEGIGGTVARTVATGGMAAIKANYGVDFESIGANSVARFDRVAQFAKNRVVRSVQNSEVYQDFKKSGAEMRPIIKQVFDFDTSLANKKLSVIELRVGKIIDDIFRMNGAATQVDNAKGLASDLGDYASTPLDNIKARKKEQQAVATAKAKERSKELVDSGAVDQYKTSGRATFVIGGFAGEKGESSPGVADRASLIFQGDSVIPVKNTETDLPANIGEGKRKYAKNVLSRFIKQNVTQGYNADSVEVAAQAMAIKQINPDAAINMVGYSAGGFVAAEATSILERAGVDSKAVGIGTPLFGLTQTFNPDRYKSINGGLDYLTPISKKGLSSKSSYEVIEGAGGGHQLNNYLGNPAAQESIMRNLGRKNEIPEEFRSSAGFILPQIQEQAMFAFEGVQKIAAPVTARKPSVAAFVLKEKQENAKTVFETIKRTRQELGQVIGDSIGSVADELEGLESMLAEMQEFVGQFGQVAETIAPIAVSKSNELARLKAANEPKANEQKALFQKPLEPIVDQAKLQTLTGAFKPIPKNPEDQATTSKRLDSYNQEVVKEVYRVSGLGTPKGTKAEMLKEIKALPLEQIKGAVDIVEPAIERGPKGGQKLIKPKQSEAEIKLIEYLKESEVRIRAASDVYAQSEGTRKTQIRTAIDNEINQLLEAAKTIDRSIVAPETRQAVGGLKGRLAQTAKFIEPEDSPQLARVAPQTAFQRIKQKASEILNLNPALASTGASIIAGNAADGLGPIARTVASLGASTAVRVAGDADRPKVSSISGLLRNPKAQAMVQEMAIAGSGMLASNFAGSQGSIAGAAAGLTATLAARMAVSAGGQYKGIIDSLRKQEAFLNAGISQKGRMLADAAKQVSFVGQADGITGDIAGFAIANGVTIAKNMVAGAIGMPALSQVPVEAIAATVLPGKVVEQRKKYDVPALARVEKPLGIIDRVKSALSPKVQNYSPEIATKNYEQFYKQVEKTSGVSGGAIPSLKVDDARLGSIGASALYDAKTNTVLISQAVANAISQPISHLGKYAKELKALTHESQHAIQMDGGRLSIVEAAQGKGVKLQSPKLSKSIAQSIDSSVSIAASQSPSVNVEAVKKLELDAYAKESQTKQIIQQMQGPRQSLFSRASEFVQSKVEAPGSRLGRKYDAIVRTAADYSGVSLTPQSMPKLAVDDEKLQATGATAYYNIKKNQITISQKAADLISGTTKDIDAYQKAVMSIIHEARHSFQFKGGKSSIAAQSFGAAQGVDLIPYGQAPRSAQFMGLQSAQVAKTQSMGLLPNNFLRTIAATEVDAYAFEKVYGPEIAQKAEKRKPQTALQKAKDLFANPSHPPDEGPINSFRSVLARAADSINQFPGGGLILGSLKGIAAGFIGVNLAMMAVQAGSKIAQESIQAAIAADRTKTALSFSTGSKSGGDAAYSYASNQAEVLGIDRKSSIEGYSKLRASSKGKLSEGQSNELFEGVASASTTLGLSADDQNGVFLALGQVMSKGTVQAEELRGQIGERLPGAFAIAARSMGMTEAQLGKQMELGAVSAEQFIPKFGAQMKQEFGPGAKDASQNLQSSMFRFSGAQGKLTENVGGAIAVPLKFGVDAAIGGMTLLEKHGGTLANVLGVILAQSAFGAAASFVAYNGGLMAMGQAALSAVGGIAGITGAIGKLATTIAPLAAKFLLINAAIEIGKTLFSSFTPDDMGSRFEKQASKIKQSLQEIEDKGKAAKSIDISAPSKGLDINAMTLGLSGSIGINRGDDVVKSISKPDGSGIADNGLVRGGAAFILPPVGLVMELARSVNEENGGKGLATMQEVQYNRSVIAASEQGDQVYKSTGGVFDKIPELRKAAESSQKEQQFIDQKQAEKARLLSTGTPDKAKVAAIDNEIKASSERRDTGGKAFADQKNLVEGQINELKAQKESLKTNADYTPEQKAALTGQLDAQLGQLDAAKRQLDAIDKKFGGSADIMGKFNVALAEMAAKIEEASAIAKNAFNKSEVSRLEGRKAGRSGDEFASQNNAVKQAQNEQTRADQEYAGSKKAVSEIDRMLEDPTVKREISKIAINGKSVDGETSAQQLEQAKAGRSDKEKSQIDKLILRRKTIDNLPELQKQSLEAEDKTFGARSALALEKTDRQSQQRDLKLKTQEGKSNFDLIKAQKKGGMNESEVEIKKAEIGKASADRGVENITKSIGEVDRLYKSGAISKEEYTKRSASLRANLVDATVKAAQAELDVEKAKNKKILEDHEMGIKKRSVERQEKTGAQSIALIKKQMGNNINESDVDIKKAEIQKQSADGEAAEVRKQMDEVDGLRKQGIITEQEFIKRKLELRSKLVDADVKAAEAALAIEQAKNRKILNEWAQTIKKREVASQRVEGAQTVSLIKGQKGNAMSDEDVAVKKAEISGQAANSQVGNLTKQLEEVAALRARGTITQEDYEKRILDIESNLIAAKTRAAEAELAIEQAKNRKIVAEFDQMQKRKMLTIDNDQSALSTNVKRSALKGEIIGQGGQTETIKYDIIATEKRIKLADEAVDKDVELRKNGTISEKDFDDRIASNNGKLRAEEEKLVNLQIQQRQGLYQREQDLFNRTNSEIIRGLELRKSRSENSAKLDSSKQGAIESVVGLARAQSDNAVARTELNAAQTGKKDSSVDVANIRLQSLGQIQQAEMLILDLKEKQTQASLRQSQIDAQIAFGKQKIAVGESKRKLKDAVLTGDQNAIANATEDLSGQQQILGMEAEKMSFLEAQNRLAMQKLGIDRQASMLGMNTEQMRAQAELARAKKQGGGGRSIGGGIQQNRVIGGESFNSIVPINTAVIMNTTPVVPGNTSGSWRDNAIGLPKSERMPNTYTSPTMIADPKLPTLIDRAERAEISTDRAVTQATGLMPLDDRNIIAAIDRITSKLDRLSSNNQNNDRSAGYSDFLDADTNNKFSRT